MGFVRREFFLVFNSTRTFPLEKFSLYRRKKASMINRSAKTSTQIAKHIAWGSRYFLAQKKNFGGKQFSLSRALIYREAFIESLDLVADDCELSIRLGGFVSASCCVLCKVRGYRRDIFCAGPLY